ncbi:MAG: hypothetical protein ACK5H0_05215 [Bacteroidota bacterium]
MRDIIDPSGSYVSTSSNVGLPSVTPFTIGTSLTRVSWFVPGVCV